ncbi:MAG: DNA-3-methyladenine glycosylase [Candidatus Bathyarchaeota archaeon]|nr:DNA-3-methyladenine glycosylase [Candidatus Bathyarchaeota archaeon]
MIISRDYYERDPDKVARGLLGKKLVRNLDEGALEGFIVETEAYYGESDPSSRAFHGQKNFNKPMWGVPGTIFIYNVHKYWMFNIVAHEPNEIGAVLIRSLEPIKGIEIMKSNRKSSDIMQLTKGPGRLTEAYGIDKRMNGKSVTSSKSKISIFDNQMDFEIDTSHRIGVKKDLDKELRFFIKGNNFVSK